MGLFKHPLAVLDPAGVRVETLEARVDTGSTYSWLPQSVFERLGVQLSEEREFILANGARERRPVAQLRISLGGPAFYTYCALPRPARSS
jgi:predicted aspartyl protease